MSLHWPVDPSALVAWTGVVLAWALANYAVGSDPAGRQAVAHLVHQGRYGRWVGLVIGRSVVLGLVTFLLTGPGVVAGLLSLLAVGAAVALPLGRRIFVAANLKAGAEWEIGGNLIFVVAAAGIVGAAGLDSGFALLHIPLPGRRIAALCAGGAAAVFVARGGTHIVRGILDKVGTVPRRATGGASSDGELDTIEYNRGRVIGVLERELLLLTVVLGTYAALGFLVAAKGVIRFKEMEDREFAEYFIVGTLASVLVAMVLGLMVRGAFRVWW